MSGYLLNELMFCSTNDSADFSFDSCPTSCVTRNASFWNAVSADFARRSTGTATVILNGTRSGGAIFNTSTFLNYELAQFEAPRVSKLVVYLLHAPGQRVQETCGNMRTLRQVEQVALSKNISFECIDDPKVIAYFMCFQPSNDCDNLMLLRSNAASPSFLMASNNLAAFSLSLLFLIIFYCFLI